MRTVSASSGIRALKQPAHVRGTRAKRASGIHHPKRLPHNLQVSVGRIPPVSASSSGLPHLDGDGHSKNGQGVSSSKHTHDHDEDACCGNGSSSGGACESHAVKDLVSQKNSSCCSSSDRHDHDHDGHNGSSHVHSHSHNEHHAHSHSHDEQHIHSHSHEDHGHSHSHDEHHGHSHGHDEHHGHSHGHDHHGSSNCCSGHHHHHGPSETNPFVEAVFKATGLRAIANLLHSSRAPIITGCVLLFAALVLPWVLPGAHSATASSAMTIGVYVLVGLPSFMDACHDFAALKVNAHVLTMMAVACLIPLGHALEGALLLLLFNLSHELEDYLTIAAQGDMQNLLDSVPSSAAVVQLGADGGPDFSTEKEVAAESIRKGDLIAVRAGQEVALDGEILQGRAMLSLEHISGESLPQLCRPGDSVPAGAVNCDGLLIIRVTATMENSTPAKMAKLAQAAQENKPRVQTLVESVLESYSKMVVGVTIAIAVLLPLVFGIPLAGTPSSPGSLYRAAGFLTTAAPCAIVMAPLVYVAAIAAAAQRGILLKGASVIDSLAGCKVVALDKTGTLTTGELTCTAVVPHLHSFDEPDSFDEADGAIDYDQPACANDMMEGMAAALALSHGSVHPVSNAISEAFGEDEVELPTVVLNNFISEPGRGVSGDCVIDGVKPAKAVFGSPEFVAEYLYDGGHLRAVDTVRSAAKVSRAGEVVSFLALEGESSLLAVHAFHFSDRPHASSPEALSELRRRVKLSMLSGDNPGSAQFMAEQLGMDPDEIRAGLRPEEKLEQVVQLRREHGRILMVGDGINDAPALATADIGLAVAPTPSTAAAAAADGVILSSSGAGLSALPFLLSLAAFTRRVVVQNLALAGIAITATALPLVAGILPLWVGVFIHEGSTLLVALNSLRPLFYKGGLPEQQQQQPRSRGLRAEAARDVDTGSSSSETAQPTQEENLIKESAKKAKAVLEAAPPAAT